MAIEDRVHAVVDPVVEDLELELVDLVYAGGRLKITIDHPDGLGTELLTRATRLISHEMDLSDPINGAYTLEVTSPGVERTLRTPAHYARSIGETVSLKLTPGATDKLRRLKGTLTASDNDQITLDVDGEPTVVGYERIAKAKTVFDWGPAPKPGKGPAGTNKNAKNNKPHPKSNQNKNAPKQGAGNKNAAQKG